MTGRPPLLESKELQDEILGYIREGMFVEQACYAAGITPATYCNWKKWAREDSEEQPKENRELYISFFEAATHAEAIAELESVRTTRSISPRELDTTGHRWYLERRHPERWGKRIKQDVKVEMEKPAEFVVKPPEEEGEEKHGF